MNKTMIGCYDVNKNISLKNIINRHITIYH